MISIIREPIVIIASQDSSIIPLSFKKDNAVEFLWVKL